MSTINFLQDSKKSTSDRTSAARAPRGFRSFLLNEMASRQKNDRKYSLRQFSRDLQTDPAAIVRILHGTVEIGPRLIRRLGPLLLLTPNEVEEFVSEASSRRREAKTTHQQLSKKHGAAPRAEYRDIQADTFKVISDWYHMAILELMQLKTFSPEPEWIAKALEISVNEVQAAIDRMIQIGLIERDPKTNSYKDKTGGFTSNISQPFFEPAHKRMQKQVLELAIRAIERTPLSRRDQSTMTLTFSTERMLEAKAWIKSFRRKFDAEFSAGPDGDSVYHLSLALYPVAQIK